MISLVIAFSSENARENRRKKIFREKEITNKVPFMFLDVKELTEK